MATTRGICRQVLARALQQFTGAARRYSASTATLSGEALPRDLSHVSQPVGSLFGEVPKGAALTSYKLQPEQVQFYRDNGYLTGVPVLSEKQVDLLLEEYQAFLDPTAPHPKADLFHEFHSNESGDPEAVLMHALGHWRISEGFHDLVWHPAVTVATAQLLEQPAPDASQEEEEEQQQQQQLQRVRLWHDQLFAKPAHHGGGVAWHQDYSYWQRTRPMNHMTVHIALDDQTLENGTLTFIPKSHHWTRDGGAPLPITSRHFTDMDSIKEILTEEELSQWEPTPALLKKGHASFHHPLLVHGSYGNNSAAPRRAAVVNYFADGTCSTEDGELLDGSGVVKAGEPLQGRFYPIVFDPEWVQALP